MTKPLEATSLHPHTWPHFEIAFTVEHALTPSAPEDWVVSKTERAPQPDGTTMHSVIWKHQTLPLIASAGVEVDDEHPTEGRREREHIPVLLCVVPADLHKSSKSHNQPTLKNLTRELETIHNIWTAAINNDSDTLTDLAKHPATQDLTAQCWHICGDEPEYLPPYLNDINPVSPQDPHWIQWVFEHGIPEELADWHSHWITHTLTQHLENTND